MAKKSAQAVQDARLKAVVELMKLGGEKSRLLTLMILGDGPMNIDQIAETLGSPKPGVGQHVRMLRVAGLLESQREGRRFSFGLTDGGRLLVEAADALSRRD